MSDFYSALAVTLFFVSCGAIGYLGHRVIEAHKRGKARLARAQALRPRVDTARDSFRERAQYERAKREAIAMVRDGEWR